MSLALRAGALALVLSLLAGCGKDKTVGPKPAEITGFWSVTSLQYVQKAAPHTTVELITAGATATCAINSDKSFVRIYKPASGPPDTTAGTWELDGDQFKVSPTMTPWPWYYDVNLSSNTLTLSGADVWYDFNGDTQYQAEEEADNNMVLAR